MAFLLEIQVSPGQPLVKSILQMHTLYLQSVVLWFPGAAVLGSLKQQNLFSCSSKIRVLAGSIPSGSSREDWIHCAILYWLAAVSDICPTKDISVQSLPVFFLISTLSLLTTSSFFYDMYSCFACMSVVHCMHAWLPRRRHWLPCNWTYGWCRESNPGPLYEQQILLNTESPF